MSEWTDVRHKQLREWLSYSKHNPWTVAPTTDLSDALDEIDRLNGLLEGKKP